MSYVSSHVSSHGQDRSALDDDNTVSIDQQEAALVWELRRLQRFLDEERDQQRFTHAIDLQREDRPPKRPRVRQRPPAKQPDSKVERLLDRLGFNRRKPAARPRSHSDPGQNCLYTMRQKYWFIRRAITCVRRTLISHPSWHGSPRKIGLQGRHRWSARTRCGQLSWWGRSLSGRISRGRA
jgi:hypothetical protein